MNTITIILTLLVQLTGKLTGGYTVRYMYHPGFSDKSRDGIIRIHGITSLVLAFLITNNYLVSYPSFKERFDSSSLWIVLTAFLLFLIFLILIGSLLTTISDLRK